MKSQILKEDQKLNHNNPISPPGRGELEITDVNNHYIDQGRMGYKVLDGCLTRCGDVWEFDEGGDDSGDSVGIGTNYIKPEIILYLIN